MLWETAMLWGLARLWGLGKLWDDWVRSRRARSVYRLEGGAQHGLHKAIVARVAAYRCQARLEPTRLKHPMLRPVIVARQLAEHLAAHQLS